MSEPAQRGSLSYKLLFWFLLISLVPVAAVGWHLVDTSLTILKEVSLRNQHGQAKGFADSISGTIREFQSVLTETARLGEFASMKTGEQERYLMRVMEVNPAFIELSVIDLKGMERVRIGRFLDNSVRMRDFFETPPFQTAVQRHHYIGSLERIRGVNPALTIAVPILPPSKPKDPPPPVKGVLLGKVALAGLSNNLENEMPESGGRLAAVSTPDGFLVAHSLRERIYRLDAKLPESVKAFLARQSTATAGGELTLEDKTKVLGAFTRIPETGWMVYVQQPLETAYRAATAMRKQIGRILLWVVGGTVVLALFVSGHISLPIRELQAAADQVKDGNFEDLPQVTLTNDEIGDLGQEFLQMSEVLRDKTDELIRAKEELEKFRSTLERRVQARTRELQAAQDELIKNERLAAMGQMASVVGHEIRNPLAVMNNSIFFIKTKLTRAEQLDEDVNGQIGVIEKQIKQASGVINEILAYSRSRELNPQILQLNHFIDKTLAGCEIPENVEVVRRFDGSGSVVLIDPEEMRSALRNIIDNAVHAMESGGALHLMTEVVDGAWARVDIRDTGPGIQPDVLDQIFSPFFTTKDSGTGLGLAVVRKVMDRHGGKVEAFSEVGKGSVFRLYLPLKGSPSERLNPNL